MGSVSLESKRQAIGRLMGLPLHATIAQDEVDAAQLPFIAQLAESGVVTRTWASLNPEDKQHAYSLHVDSRRLFQQLGREGGALRTLALSAHLDVLIDHGVAVKEGAVWRWIWQ
jgi:protein-disulfide isomerase-like protein with CxxC motif